MEQCGQIDQMLLP